MCDFVHLHCHTQYSLLDGATRIEGMMDRASYFGQKGVALTDHGNMFGAFKFVREAQKRDLKPIVGCEFYLVDDRHKRKFLRSEGERDKRYHQLLLAKNEEGYRNLSKLSSLGFLEGLYMDFPRIDKELLSQYTEGVIATSCCIGAEIPQTILHQGEEAAEEKLKWWLDLFGEDYYIELQRHRGLEDIDGLGKSQEDVNQVLLKLARKHNVKVIATNDSHYLDEKDNVDHDILLCINTGSKVKDEGRFSFPSSDFYFKSSEEMAELFKDVPDSIENTMDIWDKVDNLNLTRDVLLPAFPLPDNFKTQEEYLKHLTYKGAKAKYGEITEQIRERLDFELGVINNTGYPGYFLIVQDFTAAARELGVWVGPGRGSAAGSAVAYCLGITNVDPIKYNLLFERFLNPERVSLPDIDIDFDDEGRNKVIDYVIEKYGSNQVAQIITYGSMAAKMSIRDVGRVLDVPLSEVNFISKSYPSHPKASLNALLNEDGISTDLLEEFRSDDKEKAKKIRELAEADNQIGQMLRSARNLEGSVRNTGTHACGVIITPNDVRENVPVTKAKDSDIFVTQYDNSVVESAGLLKMDFLGLKTLTILKNAIEIIEESKGDKITLEDIPLHDEKTFDLFSEGRTIGIFQFESPGMRQELRKLKPTKFEDIVAMTALYRPGPMQYIPDFIARSHGEQEIVYDLPEMEEYLEETYGITVYQEQVMLLSQKLAGFTKGQADMLRKGMGKKQKKVIDELFPIFVEGCKSNGHPEEVVNKIWQDWEKFASYAFNKSHATCYSVVSFQSAYLKAHYPAEFLAAVLRNNTRDINKLNLFLKECKYSDIPVLSPSVNRSRLNFSVSDDEEIIIGLAGLKNVSAVAMEALIKERKENGDFKDIFDFVSRMDYSSFNKRSFEGLVLSGALDEMGIERSAYLTEQQDGTTFLETVLRFGQQYQNHKESLQNSLFGEEVDIAVNYPNVPKIEPWGNMYQLEKEKEIVGIYVSGHPLDKYRFAMRHLTNADLNTFELNKIDRKGYLVAGLITTAKHGFNSDYNFGYARFTLQDYDGQSEFYINKELYAKYKDLITEGNVIMVQGYYKENSWGNDNKQIRFSISDIKLMTERMDTQISEITVKFLLDQCNEKLIHELDVLVDEYAGDKKMNLVVWDGSQELMLESNRFVTICQEMIDTILELDLTYKLN